MYIYTHVLYMCFSLLVNALKWVYSLKHGKRLLKQLFKMYFKVKCLKLLHLTLLKRALFKCVLNCVKHSAESVLSLSRLQLSGLYFINIIISESTFKKKRWFMGTFHILYCKNYPLTLGDLHNTHNLNIFSNLFKYNTALQRLTVMRCK